MNNSNIEIISSGSNGIEIDVPEKELDDFKYQLDRKRFDYS